MARGGSKKGSRKTTGRKNPYGEPTKKIQSMVPISKETDFKTKRNKILKGYWSTEYKEYLKKKK